MADCSAADSPILVDSIRTIDCRWKECLSKTPWSLACSITRMIRSPIQAKSSLVTMTILIKNMEKASSGIEMETSMTASSRLISTQALAKSFMTEERRDTSKVIPLLLFEQYNTLVGRDNFICSY